LDPQQRIVLEPGNQLEGLLGNRTEPTAHVLRVVTYRLCSNTAMLKRLRMELGGVQAPRSGLPRFEVLERLPYLTAMTQEGLRLSYGVAPRMPRIAPDLTLAFRDL